MPSLQPRAQSLPFRHRLGETPCARRAPLWSSAWGVYSRPVSLSFLRLRPINPRLAKFLWAFKEASLSLGSFFRRCRWVDNLFDRLCGELLSAQPPAGLAD